MANEQAKQVLQQGIAAARAGRQEEARRLLQEAVKRDPQSEAAWLWLSSVAKDDKERIFCLKQLLTINPNNENAIKGLRQLGVSPGGAAAQTESVTQQTAGTPIVDDQRLSAVMPQLDPILQNYQPVPVEDLPFQWTKKRRGRVGDASAMMLRATVLGVATIFVVALLVGLLFVASKLGAPIAIFTTPTFTPTLRPTFTPTPGLTNTPSPTPFATLPPTETPNATFQKGSIFESTPTAIYPKIASDRLVKEALTFAAQGNYDEAIKLLESELTGLVNFKDENYYNIVYYMAKTYVDSGNPERAIALLNGEKNDQPSYKAALAYALYAQGNFEEALTNATEALDADPALDVAAMTAARVYIQQKKFSDARRALNIVLERNPSNAMMLIERARTHLAENNYRQAESDALLAVYIDPLNRDAHLLRIQALLDEAASTDERELRIQRYGNAVLALDEYKIVYPGDTVAWKLMGDARLGEGNVIEALQAYSQAVVVDTKSNDAFNVFVARGKLYMQQRRFQEALDDFNKAIEIKEAPEALQGRIDAASAIGNYGLASNDIARLLEQKPDDPQLLLQRAELFIRNEEFSEAEDLLNDRFINTLPESERPLARIYRSIARFKGGERPEPLVTELTAALKVRESGLGHFYRGQLYEAIDEPENAVADYEWLLYWHQVYKYSFIDQVVSRLEELRGALPSPTPTLEKPTLTPTRTPRGRATATRTPRPSRTPRASATEEEVEATATPTEEPTETPVETEEP